MSFISKIIKLAKKYRTAVSVNFNYTIPKDFFTGIYDFYMLNFLHDNISEKDYKELTNTNYSDYKNDKQIEAQININNAYNKLCIYLKKEFMNLLYQQIARQFSHVKAFYEDLDGNQIYDVLNSLDDKQKQFLNKYIKACEKNGVTGRGQSKFEDGQKMINLLKPDKIFFVKLAYKIFDKVINDGAYGGQNWKAICNAYLMFYTQNIGTAIDHTIDLQHNTGSVFYKHPKYNGVSLDVKQILDNKRNSTYPMKYVNQCSKSIQDACKYLLHSKYNISQDQFEQVKPTYSQLLSNIEENTNTSQEIYDIIEQIDKDGKFDRLNKDIVYEDKIKNKIVINTFYNYVLDNKPTYELSIFNLIRFKKIIDVKSINKGIKFLLQRKNYYVLYKLIITKKITDKKTVEKIIQTIINNESHVVSDLINSNLLNNEQMDKALNILINNKYYTDLADLIVQDKLTQKQQKMVINILIKSNSTEAYYYLIYHNKLNNEQRKIVLQKLIKNNFKDQLQLLINDKKLTQEQISYVKEKIPNLIIYDNKKLSKKLFKFAYLLNQ